MRWWIGAFLAIMAGHGSAQGVRPAMTSAAEQALWPMIGRVNVRGIGTRRMCSGTLIAPDRVLTAAHCLVAPGDRGHAAPEDVIFVAGWRQGGWVAQSAAVSFDLHPRLTALYPPMSALGTDLAVIRLAAPLDGLAPLPLARLPQPAPLLEIRGYRRDRPHALSRQTACRVTGRRPGLVQTDCPVVPGTSGAPLLMRGPAGWTVVGVITATSGTGSLAATVADWPGLD